MALPLPLPLPCPALVYYLDDEEYSRLVVVCRGSGLMSDDDDLCTDGTGEAMSPMPDIVPRGRTLHEPTTRQGS